ncbi:MAG: HK97 family phage prohead protease [Thalassobaculales bacterium]
MKTRSLRLTSAVEFRASAIEPDGTFAGYGSVFGTIDAFGDTIASGAFRASLAQHAARGTMPALLWQHRDEAPIGTWLSMEEDATGLACVGKLTLSVAQAAEAYALLKARSITGLSIGFKAVAWTNAPSGVRLLTEIDLWEVSIVTFPANLAARVTEVRSAPGSIREFEAVLRDALGFSAREAKRLASGGWPALDDRDDRSAVAELVRDLRSRTDEMTSFAKGFP